MEKKSRDHIISFSSTGVQAYDIKKEFRPSKLCQNNDLTALKFQMVIIITGVRPEDPLLCEVTINFLCKSFGVFFHPHLLIKSKTSANTIGICFRM